MPYDADTAMGGAGRRLPSTVEGLRFDEFLESASTLSERLRIFQKVSEAVAFAHSRGVVHRDLKPRNIMVGRFGEALVMDWGVARRTDAAPERLGTVVGTPPYMAPEQAAGSLEAPDRARGRVFARSAARGRHENGPAARAGGHRRQSSRRPPRKPLSFPWTIWRRMSPGSWMACRSPPTARAIMSSILIGSTVKGMAVGVVSGVFARKVRSVPMGIAFGAAVGLLFAWFVAMMPEPDGSHYYVQIMTPGFLVGAIIGFLTQRLGTPATITQGAKDAKTGAF